MFHFNDFIEEKMLSSVHRRSIVFLFKKTLREALSSKCSNRRGFRSFQRLFCSDDGRDALSLKVQCVLSASNSLILCEFVLTCNTVLSVDKNSLY